MGSTEIAAEPARRRLSRPGVLARRLVLTAAVLGGLRGFWEGYRRLWGTTGRTRPFVVDYLTMPHIHEMFQRLFEPSRAEDH